ncbi:protein kinase domain-containing protein [Allostreptomyces psammosilenae]|uniref:non-specific serine/threonine protein kinase n=1 Tax=Allostreptomyces psammosilenae TaxID=1892865 RepID=A0A853A486_9ACTN|nr:protein kinase [Allostreptomyces psammosilenae]NYI05312.1 tRNA A-37 threonylcarbamoyl transferase component Bud32 [Allostreptomyces psammosilenae]
MDGGADLPGRDQHGGDARGRSVGHGRYLLQDLLGQGGMASVHRAHDTVLDRTVAVKTLHTELGREQSFRERFRREAQAVARLNHSNIVSVFDSGEDVLDGASVPFIVMEYVEGRSLREVLDEAVATSGALSVERATTITTHVLAALEASHECGLVHRDIKPGNVMVTGRGEVKVMDFGIARALQSGVTSMTQTGMVVGTPQYLSPEQALGRQVDARSDLYSVGCMLFELLTGRTPFDGDSPLAVAYQHVQAPPPRPSEFNRSVPPGVDALVVRALAKDPAERFPSAETMAQEIRRVMSGGGAPVGGPAGPATPPPPPPVGTGAGTGAGGGYATPQPQTPSTAGPGGYPGQPSYGPATPAPTATPYGPRPGASTPPPYPTAPRPAPAPTPPPGSFTPAPSRPGGSGGSTALIVIGAVVLGFFALLLILMAIGINTSDDASGSGGSSGGSSSSSGSAGTDALSLDADDLDILCSPEEEDGEVYVPAVTLMTIADARTCVENAGLVLDEQVAEEESLFDSGDVIEQDPGSYELVEPGSTVTVWVVP